MILPWFCILITAYLTFISSAIKIKYLYKAVYVGFSLQKKRKLNMDIRAFILILMQQASRIKVDR